MKITVNRKELERELTIAKKVIGRGCSLMIVNSILISIYQDGVAITSTDLNQSYTGVIGDRLHNYWVPDNSDQILVNLAMLMKVVKSISKKTTEISLEFTWDGDGLLVNGTTTIVSSGRIEDYPELLKFPASTQYNLFTYEGLSQVNSLHGYKDDKRAHINCLYADTENGRLASTDGSRLYLSKIPIVKSIKPFLIEKNSVNILCSPQLRNHIGPVRIKDNHIFIDTDNGYLSVRQIEGEFPDCGFLVEMFGKDPEAVVSMSDKQVVIDAMTEAVGILNESYHGVTININGKVSVSATNPDAGEFSKDISSEVTKSGIDLELGLNPFYVIDACKQIPDKGLNLLFPGDESPMLIESTLTDFQAAIMPMRV